MNKQTLKRPVVKKREVPLTLKPKGTSLNGPTKKRPTIKRPTIKPPVWYQLPKGISLNGPNLNQTTSNIPKKGKISRKKRDKNKKDIRKRVLNAKFNAEMEHTQGTHMNGPINPLRLTPPSPTSSEMSPYNDYTPVEKAHVEAARLAHIQQRLAYAKYLQQKPPLRIGMNIPSENNRYSNDSFYNNDSHQNDSRHNDSSYDSRHNDRRYYRYNAPPENDYRHYAPRYNAPPENDYLSNGPSDYSRDSDNSYQPPQAQYTKKSFFRRFFL